MIDISRFVAGRGVKLGLFVALAALVWVADGPSPALTATLSWQHQGHTPDPATGASTSAGTTLLMFYESVDALSK